MCSRGRLCCKTRVHLEWGVTSTCSTCAFVIAYYIHGVINGCSNIVVYRSGSLVLLLNYMLFRDGLLSGQILVK